MLCLSNKNTLKKIFKDIFNINSKLVNYNLTKCNKFVEALLRIKLCKIMIV